MCQIKEVKLHAQSFKMMHNLRVLQFYKSKKFQDSNVNIPSFLESLPDGLRFLRWDGFPQRSLPLDFSPENLVKLEMRDCQLEQLWERDQVFKFFYYYYYYYYCYIPVLGNELGKNSCQ